MLDDSEDLRVRIFDDLDSQAAFLGGALPGSILDEYQIDGEHLRLRDVGRGIRNIASWDSTLAVVSYETGAYHDREVSDGVWRYPYEVLQTGPKKGSIGSSNAKLENAMHTRASVIMFVKPKDWDYIPLGLVQVVEADRNAREFVLALSPVAPGPAFDSLPSSGKVLVREWALSTVRRRVHQPEFRRRILRAYEQRCTVCRLAKEALLDAAHIIADRDDWGDPETPNGMAMCKIHHTAYDRNLLGITPEYGVRINHELLADQDGPMLLHGLQEMHGIDIQVPKHTTDLPDRDRLAQRYAEFQNA